MRATVTPAQTAGEIEQVIRQNETTVFAPGRYCLERPLRLLGLQSRTLLGEPGAALCGAPFCLHLHGRKGISELLRAARTAYEKRLFKRVGGAEKKF